jgi:hypothetical protein
MQRPNNEYYKSFCFYNYLKANLKNDTTIESIESVMKALIYTNHLITKDHLRNSFRRCQIRKLF